MTTRRRSVAIWATAACLLGLLPSGGAFAQELRAASQGAVTEAWRQSLSDAWWTGPMLAASPETLPPGHAYTEPYVYDFISGGDHNPGSLSYILYGLADRLTVGVIPKFAFGARSPNRELSVGDIKLLAQYRLTQFTAERRIPTIALVIQETLPTGRYERLSEGVAAQGAGAFATTGAIYVQHYFRMPNGRLFRARLNASKTFPGKAKVRDRSAYGTSAGFRGTAHPGSTTTLDASFEYSVTRNWVLATDFVHERSGSTKVSGRTSDGLPIETRVAGGRYFAIAPAVEYSWSSAEGILLGIRIIPKQDDVPKSFTPAIAFSKSW
jgi:hypothetical protein